MHVQGNFNNLITAACKPLAAQELMHLMIQLIMHCPSCKGHNQITSLVFQFFDSPANSGTVLAKSPIADIALDTVSLEAKDKHWLPLTCNRVFHYNWQVPGHAHLHSA